MPIEHAAIRLVGKPWGSADLRPWSDLRDDGAAIGELWFERADPTAPAPALLLKLLFTTAPLSIQVHPDDDFARSIGLAHGKTEAWYILSADAGAKVALGLTRRLDARQLRAAVGDGSIADLVSWRAVATGDALLVQAGTIHAVGAGLVLAEIQQRSDATFRLFDYGSRRELHPDRAVAAATPGPATRQPASRRLSDSRTLLVASPDFVLERIAVAPASRWHLDAAHETWLLVLAGQARIGAVSASIGEAIFLDGEQATLDAGPDGLTALLAYAAAAVDPTLLQEMEGRSAGLPSRRRSPHPVHPRSLARSHPVEARA